MRLRSWHYLGIFLALVIGWIFAGQLLAGVPQTKVHKPTGDKIQVESGGEIEIKSGGTLDIQSGATTTFGGLVTSEDITVDDLAAHETFILGETTAKSTFTPTAVTLDDGVSLTNNGTTSLVGETTLTGLVKTVGGLHVGGSSDPGTDNLVVDGTATVTGMATLTGGATLGGLLYPYPRTEAELKASTPTFEGGFAYDSTNKTYVQSTGTTNCLDWSKFNEPTTAPVGW